MSRKTRVLIIDDSALVRKLLSELIGSADDMEVVGTAHDPYQAREKIKQLDPDVLTLDVEMPKMDGLDFLRNLMRLRPMPVIMISSLTRDGADVTLKAMEIGAVDYISKPVLGIAQGLTEYRDELITKLRTAAGTRVEARTSRTLPVSEKAMAVDEKHSADVIIDPASGGRYITTDALVAIGSSTGGTEAIKEVLTQLPADSPGIVITQHIPGNFSAPFAERLDKLCRIRVSQAEDGEHILPGNAYIAPGDSHLLVKRNGARYHCALSDGPPVNRHRPSVDVLFRSAAQCAGPNALGILLTGMGDDGARGLKEMQEAGARTICQDEKSSVVWGMPGAAVKLGAADEVIPLDKVAARLDYLTRQQVRFGT
ncbi:MAG: chemotaxis response regulator protein-glutamate methylesterase [Gammaproteobacteria bacterium]|nr:MAG: chemotaxis response regulator protein-glutamate methylesterase [Gammaproteobacteria bacterium]PIE36857.1 MAG: chemotaxis response regulator protein-glutamate methylesterase [Gammaproteobacteria bacterium]